MPIFEYECRSCGRSFEKLVTASAQVRCEQCDSDQVEKKFSTFAAKIGAACGRKSSCPSADSPHCCAGGCKHH